MENNGIRDILDPVELAPMGPDYNSSSLHTADSDTSDDNVEKIMASNEGEQINEQNNGEGKELVTAIREGVKKIIIGGDSNNANKFHQPNTADHKKTELQESGDVRRYGSTSYGRSGRCCGLGAQRPASGRSFNGTPNRYRRVWRPSASARSHSGTMASPDVISPPRWLSRVRSDHDTQPIVDYPTWSPSAGDSGAANRSSMGNKIYPVVYASPTGTIFVTVNMGVIIEIAADRSVRLFCHDKFSSVCNGSGTTACILHPKARIYQNGEKIFCNFSAAPYPTYKAAAFGVQGVLFTMSHLAEVYLVSNSDILGTSSIPLGQLQFPSLDYDFTIHLFYTESQNGAEFTELCNDIVKRARHGMRDDGSLTLTINGIYIKQMVNGDVEVNCRPRHISCSPSKGTIRVRTDSVDIAVQEDDKAYVKRGMKHLHVSRSGMVASDGSYVMSMDHLGRIVSPPQ
uniref:Uncharacterized protein n=1 Tax=Parascaris univalens TaxID=6257 RepID=A0A915BX26_PARUN